MITVSDPTFAKVNDVEYSVALTVTYTDDTTKEVLGTRSINANIPKDEDALNLLQPFIDKATDELLNEYDELSKFKSQFDGFKDSVNTAIASRVQAKIGGKI